jgi:hypothetical protein
VTRDIPSLIKAGGFKIERIDEAYLAPFPQSGSYFYWGVARPEVCPHDYPSQTLLAKSQVERRRFTRCTKM